VRDLAAIQPVLKQLPVVFDRLVWRLVDHPRSSLLTKKEAQERGLVLLPAAQKARIGLADVTSEGFNALLSARDGYQRQVEILRVRKVSPNTHRYMPVELLVYGDPSRGEIELAVCLESELQVDHGLALDGINAVARLGLSVGQPEPRPVLEQKLEEQRVNQVEVEFLATSNPDEHPSQPGALKEVADLPVRSVSVFEHADLLAGALDGSKRRLLIISPWVRSAVVTTDFIAKLERRLKAGVEVTVAHGYGDDDSGSDEYALKRLANLAGRYRERFILTRVKNTHAKILISDDQWVTSSFNWLSFRGDPERTYRMEEGTLVQIPAEVDKAYERYRGLISEQRV
jgi:phosphatidylserine/phosphatidylglycerophosphate/cardiolipin synthase-like enzyme